MALEINILGYDADDTAESGTTTTNIKMTSHGLETGDYIVNTTRKTDADRGSRKVTKVDADNVTVDAITGQTSGDTIKKFKFTDRAGLLRTGSLSAVETSDNDGTASFTIHTTTSYIPRTGQEIIIEYNSTKRFAGIISEANRRATSQKGDSLYVDIQCDGYNVIPGRRTVQANHTNATAGEIVEYWIDNALNQEGITAGTIDDGCTYTEFIDSVMTIKEILDKCANDSGYKWYIDKDKKLHFVQDDSSITDSTNNLLDSGSFDDFWNLNYKETMDEYTNKVFVVGGSNDYGYVIFVSQEDETESAARQAIEAGSGVYGMVYEDSSIETATYNPAESGTTTTNIKITGHGLAVGDYLYNFTQGEGRNVTAVVDANNVTVEAVTSQSDGDEIIIYTDANAIISNALKKNGIVPATITFSSSGSFTAGQRLRVDLADYAIDDSYYLIERVEHFDFNGKVLHTRVTATARKTSNFSTQKKNGAREYFAEIIAKAKGQSGVDASSESSSLEVEMLEVTSESDYSAFATETELDGIDVDFKKDTAVNFQVRADLAASAAAAYTVKVRVDGTAVSTGTWYMPDTNKDMRIFTGTFSGIEVGTKTVDVTLTPASGNGTILTGEYQLSLIISDIVAEAEVVVGASNMYNYAGYSYSSGSNVQTNVAYNFVGDSWSSKTSCPSPARDEAGSSGSTVAYLMCGDSGSLLQDNDGYTTSGDSWANLTSAPSPARDRLVATEILEKEYIIGGAYSSWSADNDEYDSEGDSWANKTSMSDSNYSMGAATLSDKGYVFGGGRDTDFCGEYDPSGNSWANKTNMTYVRNRPEAAEASGKAYVGNGYPYNTYWQEYDPSGNSWAAKTAMPHTRDAMSSVGASDKVYVNMGRAYPASTDSTVNEEYDPSGNSWATLTSVTSGMERRDAGHTAI